jgi:ribosomal protein S18 acetylase RimI-like enzyme
MFTIRAGTMGDVDAVVELWNRAAGPSRQGAQHVEARQLMARDPQSLLVANGDGGIVGTLIVGWDGWRCHLYRLAVDEKARRSGVATALTGEAMRRARGYGASRLDAMVHADNDGAVAFWESVGLRLDGHDSRWSMPL